MIYHYVILKAIMMKDHLGIFCSGLCIIHCIATPFILGLGITGVLASVIATELIHLLLLLPITTLIILTAPTAYIRYGNVTLVITALLGMMFLIGALLLEEDLEVLLTVIGGSLLVMFHLWNLHLYKKTNRAMPADSKVL